MAMPGLENSLYPRVVERYRYHYLTQDQDLTLLEGVREMLADLSQQGYFLAVATGKSRVGLNHALHATNLLSVFDATRCTDETFSKPHPTMLQELTRELGQDMRRTVMIGDTTYNLQIAINAGTVALAVDYGAHPVNELNALDAIFTASSVVQLHTWLSDNG